MLFTITAVSGGIRCRPGGRARPRHRDLADGDSRGQPGALPVNRASRLRGRWRVVGGGVRSRSGCSRLAPLAPSCRRWQRSRPASPSSTWLGTAPSRMWQTGGTSSTQRTLMWVDRQGREQPVPAPPRPYASARLSPDGTRIAVEIEDRNNDIWVWDLRRETLTRVTSDPGRDESPVWTRDGRRLAFTSETGGVMGTIFWRPADGSGQPEQLGDGSRIQRASSVTPDGRQLLLSDATGLTTITLDGSRELRPLAALARGGGDGVVSPEWPVAGLRRAGRRLVKCVRQPVRRAGSRAGRW